MLHAQYHVQAPAALRDCVPNMHLQELDGRTKVICHLYDCSSLLLYMIGAEVCLQELAEHSCAVHPLSGHAPPRKARDCKGGTS